jgi:hypothetical protein
MNTNFRIIPGEIQRVEEDCCIRVKFARYKLAEQAGGIDYLLIVTAGPAPHYIL